MAHGISINNAKISAISAKPIMAGVAASAISMAANENSVARKA
jgi:hypothetical protein